MPPRDKRSTSEVENAQASALTMTCPAAPQAPCPHSLRSRKRAFPHAVTPSKSSATINASAAGYSVCISARRETLACQPVIRLNPKALMIGIPPYWLSSGCLAKWTDSGQRPKEVLKFNAWVWKTKNTRFVKIIQGSVDLPGLLPTCPEHSSCCKSF